MMVYLLIKVRDNVGSGCKYRGVIYTCCPLEARRTLVVENVPSVHTSGRNGDKGGL